MKNFKKLILIACVFLLTGCFKSEELDQATIRTTIYPIEYVANYLYGYNSEVKSIYPDGIDVNEYTLSNKKIKKYSKEDLFIYNGLTDEKKIAASFVNKNSRLKIIDVSKGLAFKYGEEELWLNPTNYLMIAQNIKNGLNQYINSTILKKEINANYDKLKEMLSEFETSLKLIGQNGKNNTLIVSKNYFKFLENYGFNIVSLDEETLTEGSLNSIKNNFKKNTYNTIFVLDNNYTDNINSIVNDYKAKTIDVKSMINVDSNNNDDYLTVMQNFIDNIRNFCIR